MIFINWGLRKSEPTCEGIGTYESVSADLCAHMAINWPWILQLELKIRPLPPYRQVILKAF